ncbi:MAG: hypothetical protein Q9183_006501 [Haloplaca sp. 2 TL-2023]
MLAAPLRPGSSQNYSQPETESSFHHNPVQTLPTRPAPAPAMLSTMPTPRPLTPKRPKLSLQTCPTPGMPAGNRSRTALNNLSSIVDSPTTFHNTTQNAFDIPPATPVSANPHNKEEAFSQLRQPERPSPQHSISSSSVSTLSSGPSSPFPSSAPYTLNMGSRSILRNSPLPKRHITHISNRPPKRLFHPIRSVSFPETLVEFIPSPVLPESDVNMEDDTKEGTSSEVAAAEMAEDSKPMPPSPIKGRRKRRGRDWIWRPVDEESSPMSGPHELPLTATPTSIDNKEPGLEEKPLTLLSTPIEPRAPDL